MSIPLPRRRADILRGRGHPRFAFHSSSELRYRRSAMPPGGRDTELVDRANRGDVAALGELYRRYQRFVFGLAVRQLGHPDDAMDVLQDTFVNLFARFPGFELKASLASFLHPVVDHLCRDRRAREQARIDIDEVYETEPSLSTTDSSDDDVARLLSRLAPAQRELLTMCFIGDLSLSQLAEAFDVPIGTIKSRMHRAIVALREKLKKSDK